MNRNLMWIGLMATGLLLVTLGMAVIREPALQARAATAQQAAAVAQGLESYLENCIVCHGASGEGIATYPALNTAASMDSDTLYKTIERGRFNTQMAAFSVDEGGILSDSQISGLVALIQYGNWGVVSTEARARGVVPPEMVVAEIPPETLAVVQALPSGESLVTGLNLYAENCTACHGPALEGSKLAPSLNTDTVRAKDPLEIVRIVEQGVPGTLMAGWDHALTDPEADALAVLIQQWPTVQAAGVAIPVVAAEPIDMSPEAVARGAKLFNIACASCHGAAGYGTIMAPALNNALFLNNTSDTQINQIISMGVSGTKMPAWGGRLSDAQINDVIAYLRSMQATAPAIPPAR